MRLEGLGRVKPQLSLLWHRQLKAEWVVFNEQLTVQEKLLLLSERPLPCFTSSPHLGFVTADTPAIQRPSATAD